VKKAFSFAVALVCLLAASAEAQDPRSTSEQTIVLDISVVEVGLNRAEEFEAIGKDRGKLNSLISEGKARPVASLQLRTKSNEQATARVGQRVPITIGMVPAFNVARRPDQGSQPIETQGSAYPQIQYENTGLNVDVLPRVLSNGQIDTRIKIELSAVDASTGRMTPSFVQRTLTDVVRLRPGETALLLGVMQHELLWPSSGQPTAKPGDTSRGSFIVVMTARLVE
jgi:type II secretory pathway component HofQ